MKGLRKNKRFAQKVEISMAERIFPGVGAPQLSRAVGALRIPQILLFYLEASAR